MIRLLISGTSHVGAVKGGWDLIAADYAGKVEVTFFAVPAARYGHLRFDGTRFGADKADIPSEVKAVAQAINGRTWVDLADYDHVLMVGQAGSGKYELIADILAGYDLDGLPPRGKPQRLSWSAFVAALDDRASGLVARLAAWRAAARGGISLMTPPRTLETVLVPGAAANRPGLWDGLGLSPADLRRTLDAYDSRRAHALDRLGIRMVPKPDAVLGPSGFTAARFKAGALRLAGEKAQPEDDLQHMNAEYGAVVLRDFLSTLLAGTRPALSA